VGGIGARDSLNQFASARAVTIAAVTPLSQELLNFSPRPGRWSIGEIADHLLLAEELYRREVAQLVALARAGQPTYRKHSFAEVNVAPLHLPDALLAGLETPLSFLSRLMPDAVRSLITEFPILPTRNPDFATPRRHRPAAALKADLAASIASTRLTIEGNADLDFDALVSEHPLTGRTNVWQILSFLAKHERRHQSQMEKVRIDARFPRA
jgi:uncharacterized damage-inducible protein DinB